MTFRNGHFKAKKHWKKKMPLYFMKIKSYPY